MRTGLKLSSKNLRACARSTVPAASGAPFPPALSSPPSTGRGARIALPPCKIALQLFRNASKAAAWSSSFQPSILAKASGSTCALRNFISCAAAGPPTPAIRHNAKLEDSKPAPICERGGNAAMRSLPGFGSDQFPVRIARRQIAGECPYVGDVGHLLGIAVDHVAVLVARHRY